MEATILRIIYRIGKYRGYMGIMEKKIEDTMMGII